MGDSFDPEKQENTQLVRQKRLFSFLQSKKIPPLPTEEERKPYGEKHANILSKLFFWWLFPTLSVGYKRTIQPEDLFVVEGDIAVEQMNEKFQKHFLAYYDNARRAHLAKKAEERGESSEKSSVSEDEDMKDFEMPSWLPVKAIARTFGAQYAIATLFLILGDLAQTCNPLQSRKLIQFVEERALGVDVHIGKGLGYAFGTTILVFLNGLFMNHAFYRAMLTGAQTKAVLTKAILEKSFRLNGESQHRYPPGKITSMMSTDLQRIDFAMAFQQFIFAAPIPLGVSIGILIYNIGPASLVGVGVLILFLFGIGLAARSLIKYRKLANVFTDERVNAIKEVIQNLRIIKFYTWEEPYSEKIRKIRAKEMNTLLRTQIVRNFIISMGMSLPVISSMVSFLSLYAIKSGTGGVASIFSSLSLFNVLAQEVLLIPMALTTGVDAFIGLKRVGKFLCGGELRPGDVTHYLTEVSPEKGNSIVVDDASFVWEMFEEEDKPSKDTAKSKNKEKKEKKNKEVKTDEDKIIRVKDKLVLDKISLSVKKGEFIVITGSIGTGKSSLLSAIAGTMKCSSGKIYVADSLVHCGSPWVQNETVKENIVFGLPYDEKFYNEVIYSCSLENDLEILPAGDLTEIGERGITLSGGQKARINLARAVYANKNIVLLDDVLSAVDAKVGKHIMKNCLMGLLKDQTRLLVTHQLSLIQDADRIVYLPGDGSIQTGTLQGLMASSDGFRNLMAFNSENHDDDDEEEEENEEIEIQKDKESSGGLTKDTVSSIDSDYAIRKEANELTKEISRSYMEKTSAFDDEDLHRDYQKNRNKDGRLFKDEEKAVNRIKPEVYKSYFKAGQGIFPYYSIIPISLLLIILSTFTQIFTNTWLSYWVSHKFKHRADSFYIGLYIMFSFLSFFLLTVSFMVLAYLSNNAARTLNIKAMTKLMRAPMSFMDTTPMGRILNRFTKDTDVLDNELGDQTRMFSFIFPNIIAVVILCICYLPWFAISIPFLAIIFFAIADYYQASAREVKRLEATQRSLVYNSFSETLGGMATIKAYKAEGRFLHRNAVSIDKTNEAYYVSIANQRWLGIHLDVIATLFALIIALLSVFRVFNINAASVGLLLSYVLEIAGQLSMVLRVYTQLENEMNSVERLHSYANYLPQEAPAIITENRPRDTWPEKGEIKFEKASMAYREGLPLALKDMTTTIKSNEKVGICGRTGAGKSSVMSTLFRLSELSSGRIIIDDVDISTIGLTDLRSKLTIIPQDPILFRGTIRSNLDPFGDFSDDALLDSMKRANLIEKEIVHSSELTSMKHKFELGHVVEEEGSNYSLGERQLIVFARALVQNSKILVLDEATSSVDYETDSKIQETIKREFNDCTILCIAHRLRTIINYDKILVLDKGTVKEFDIPRSLFDLEGGIFRQMCDKAGIVAEDFETN
ncbi:Piso0_005899 [Millerozyma farinosa CBS 7064]|uniref:Piso0_005899 protein n=1 Tax=Pichia sorbitophila (strain ATCC MYA-4447 / BCRC 22081 / CBS 7064 / NBRC 10061 / NRRL Y-12695) TaxID=559304 RepID=G8Y379_PICSO|nr:Piso0_005899 [Millerozyma farinosa CBS 7064]